MGNEAFIIHLQSRSSDEPAALTLLVQLGFVEVPVPRETSPREHRFVREDPRHLIEGLLSVGARKLHLSLRFSLCHPPTIDDVFLDLVHDLRGHSFEPVYAEDALPGAIRSEIEQDRRDWRAAFGQETHRLSCDEARRRFLMRPARTSE